MMQIEIDWAKEVSELLQRQMQDWSLLKSNYENLARVEYRRFMFDGFEIEAQFNPARIISTSADLSKEAILKRKCFLCKENRPGEQEELLYKNEFLILANPFPILPEHFTVSSTQHIEQSIINRIPIFLELNRDLGENYSVYYNGPRCGASAPDHLHFQAGTKNVLPLEKNFDLLKKKFFVKVLSTTSGSIYSIENILRNGFSVESNSFEETVELTTMLIQMLRSEEDLENEPMTNIICTYENAMWRVIIFPRRAHRPKEYFAEDRSKVLISPAIMDLGGLLITPRKEDFENLTEELMVNIFSQVTLNDLSHQALIQRIKHTLS